MLVPAVGLSYPKLIFSQTRDLKAVQQINGFVWFRQQVGYIGYFLAKLAVLCQVNLPRYSHCLGSEGQWCYHSPTCYFNQKRGPIEQNQQLFRILNTSPNWTHWFLHGVEVCGWTSQQFFWHSVKLMYVFLDVYIRKSCRLQKNTIYK